jgi:23S rRNA pseudouridine1911/1915/1917 synthase
MAAARTFHIRPVLDGQSLASALKRLLPQQSWSDVKRLIAQRHVHVNGNLSVDEGRRLKAGDVVKVFEHPRAAPPTERDVRVRYIDDDLVVVEKPAGVTTLRHADERDWPQRRKDRMATLEEILQRVVGRRHPSTPAAARREAPPAKGAKHPLPRRLPPKPGRSAHRPPAHSRPPQVRPVHRLDRDTSGLMIFALSPQAEQALVRQFKNHEIDRKYLAVVHGHPDARTIETHLVRDRGDGLRGSSPRGADDPDAQRAVTHIKPLERVGDYAVIECRLETGRTHQIRIHLAETGHMLCGEKTYTRTAPNVHPSQDRSGAPRQALHSTDLTFTHPITHKPMHFHSPLPPDLAQWLDRLRKPPKP